MRQVVLDTETTGIGEGHRIIEIGCVEVIERKLTGRHFHVYINPQREIDEEAAEVHGITNEWLIEQNAPVFEQVVNQFCDFIRGAELVIHNAAFDVGMMDYEFRLLNLAQTSSFCGILDTLALARDLHPGARNNLDALCKRYGIDNSHRELHGALLDAEILADVYLLMTGGQTDLALHAESANTDGDSKLSFDTRGIDLVALPVINCSADESAAHEKFLDLLDSKCERTLFRSN